MLNKLRNWLFPNSHSDPEYFSRVQGEHPIDAFPEPPDIGSVRGQRDAKLALLIAAAGAHNLLMIGPPGEGKSFLASTLPSFLPPLLRVESEALGPAYALSGLPLPTGGSRRPYRPVGPTASLGSLIGGGRSAATIFPGDLALAHSGVLFIDELPQFDRALVDSLRQPLESGLVTVTRGGSSATWPCRVQLIAAMNPCPCGFYGMRSPNSVSAMVVGNSSYTSYNVDDEDSPSLCTCSPHRVEQYQARISGPILDRIDLVCWLQPLSPQERFSDPIPNQSLSFLLNVLKAQKRQRKRIRVASGNGQRLNSQLGANEIFDKSGKTLEFTPRALQDFQELSGDAKYSTRKTVRLGRVCRTVADLHDSDSIEHWHVAIAHKFVSQSILGD